MIVNDLYFFVCKAFIIRIIFQANILSYIQVGAGYDRSLLSVLFEKAGGMMTSQEFMCSFGK